MTVKSSFRPFLCEMAVSIHIQGGNGGDIHHHHSHIVSSPVLMLESNI